MTVVYPTSDVVTAGFAAAVAVVGGVVSISPGNTLAVDEQIYLVSTSFHATQFNGQVLNIILDGDAVGNDRGINLDFSNPGADRAFNYRVLIGQTGSVKSFGHGIYIGSNSHSAVRIGNFVLDNAGEVTSLESMSAFMS